MFYLNSGVIKLTFIIKLTVNFKAAKEPKVIDALKPKVPDEKTS